MVAYLFIAASLVVVTVGNTTQQPLIYVLVAAGVFLVVVGQEMLPATMLGGRRLAIEALTMIVFVSILVVLTGGYVSPFFVGYVLLVAGASLWGNDNAPLLLAGASCAAYLAAVLITPLVMGGTFPPEAMARVGFILVALGLVAYVASVISREQRRSSEAALALSRFDALTRLFSRSYFERAVEQEILRASRTGRGFSMLLLDLDALKSVNDSHGHDAGDRLLGAIGEVMRGDVRATDTAARLGGDEFVVILPETELAGALRVAEKLRRDIGHLAVPTNGNLVSSSVSVGVVSYPDDARTKEELLRRADRAMYEAKRRGKDQIVHYPRPLEGPAPTEVDPSLARVELAPRVEEASDEMPAPVAIAMGADELTTTATSLEAAAAEAGPEATTEAGAEAQVEVSAVVQPTVSVEAQSEVVISGDAPWWPAPEQEHEPEAVVSGNAPWE